MHLLYKHAPRVQVRDFGGDGKRRIGLISGLWRLINVDRPDVTSLRFHASIEDLARAGKMPSNYPFCTRGEVESWLKDNGDGKRSLCCALAWLIQNWVLRTQNYEVARPVPCNGECAKCFQKMYSSLQLQMSRKALLLDPAVRATNLEHAPCQTPAELRRFRSNLLILSALAQLADEQNKLASRSLIFKNMASSIIIPHEVSTTWHFHTDIILHDFHVREAYITACIRVLEQLGERSLSVHDVADTLQKMLKLTVLELSCEKYGAGSCVATVQERQQAASVSGASAFTQAQDAENQRKFTSQRICSAQKLMKILLTRMGGIVRTWLQNPQIAITKGTYGELENVHNFAGMDSMWYFASNHFE